MMGVSPKEVSQHVNHQDGAQDEVQNSRNDCTPVCLRKFLIWAGRGTVDRQSGRQPAQLWQPSVMITTRGRRLPTIPKARNHARIVTGSAMI